MKIQTQRMVRVLQVGLMPGARPGKEGEALFDFGDGCLMRVPLAIQQVQELGDCLGRRVFLSLVIGSEPEVQASSAADCVY
jgi:hypothetical protein